MSNPFKALVAAACIAVVAFVGYFFLNEYRRSAAETHQVQARAKCENTLLLLAQKYGVSTMTDGEEAELTTCIAAGFYTSEEAMTRIKALAQNK